MGRVGFCTECGMEGEHTRGCGVLKTELRERGWLRVYNALQTAKEATSLPLGTLSPAEMMLLREAIEAMTHLPASLYELPPGVSSYAMSTEKPPGEEGPH